MLPVRRGSPGERCHLGDLVDLQRNAARFELLGYPSEGHGTRCPEERRVFNFEERHAHNPRGGLRMDLAAHHKRTAGRLVWREDCNSQPQAKSKHELMR